MAKKPQPEPTPDSQPYWEGCRQGELRLQVCESCGKHQFYPRAICSHCHAGPLQWRKASGKGEVWSFSVVHRPVSRAFAADVPYTVAIVALAEGPRMMTNIVGCAPEEVHIGMAVELALASSAGEPGPEAPLPVFRPAAR